MAELTPEQLQAAETMPLAELLELAKKGDEAPPMTAAPAPATSAEPTAQARDAQGRFTEADTLDNSAEAADTQTHEEVETEPVRTIYRREIPNGSGSVDVYEADSLEELVDKIAEGKQNANKKIQEFIAEKRQATAQATQISKDDEYVVQQRLKDNPKAAIKEVVAEVIEERMTRVQRSADAQSHFINTHPDYVPDPENGNRLKAWLQTHGYTEFTAEGLEKGYQDLKRSGLLKLKAEGASDATEANDASTQQTAEPAADATQQRSQRKGSTVSTRSSSRATVPTNMQPAEDELYKMPLEQLRSLADKQLAEANRQQ